MPYNLGKNVQGKNFRPDSKMYGDTFDGSIEREIEENPNRYQNE
jgi:hypothetical protein